MWKSDGLYYENSILMSIIMGTRLQRIRFSGIWTQLPCDVTLHFYFHLILIWIIFILMDVKLFREAVTKAFYSRSKWIWMRILTIAYQNKRKSMYWYAKTDGNNSGAWFPLLLKTSKNSLYISISMLLMVGS